MEPKGAVTKQLSIKADVLRATHEKVQWCQDAHTEFALIRRGPCVCRVNHILRVHGRRGTSLRRDWGTIKGATFPTLHRERTCAGYTEWWTIWIGLQARRGCGSPSALEFSRSSWASRALWYKMPLEPACESAVISHRCLCART